MDEHQIRGLLAGIGLNESEISAYLKKVSDFYDSLTPAEQQVFRAGERAQKHEAANSFQGLVTAEELEEFIKSREPAGAHPVFLLWKCHHHGDEGGTQ